MKKYLLIEKDHGQENELKEGTIKEIVKYLEKNYDDLFSWIESDHNSQLPDELEKVLLPELEAIETARDLKTELEKVNLDWWTLEIEEMEEKEMKRNRVIEDLKKNTITEQLEEVGKINIDYIDEDLGLLTEILAEEFGYITEIQNQVGGQFLALLEKDDGDSENIDWLEDYIAEEIEEKSFDEYGQIKIDFAGLGEGYEIRAAAENLGYEIEGGEGQGVYWIYKAD